MIAPMNLSLEDVTFLVGQDNAYNCYYETGATFLTTRTKLLMCKLEDRDRLTVESLPPQGFLKVITEAMGEFSIDVNLKHK